AAIARVTALVMRRAHEDAIDRARVDAQGAEHALRVIDLEAVDAETLSDRVLDLVDVNAIDRAGAGTLVAADAGGQIEAMEPPIPRLHRHRQLGILEMLRERLAFVGLQEIPEGNPHPLADGLNRDDDIAEPTNHARARFAWCGWVFQGFFIE